MSLIILYLAIYSIISPHEARCHKIMHVHVKRRQEHRDLEMRGWECGDFKDKVLDDVNNF